MADAPSLVAMGRRPQGAEVLQPRGGEHQVNRALRKTLWKYRLHEEQHLFDRAYAYIREYY